VTIDDEEELARVLVQRIKDHNLDIARELARERGISGDVIATAMSGVVFGLGVTMMVECGYSADDLATMIHKLVANLMAPPDERGAS